MNDYATIIKLLKKILAQQTCENDLPGDADYFAQTNPDAGGNYQTITYRRGGAAGDIVAVASLTFDGSGNVLTYSITYS